jgi:hypothetical protein
MASVVYTAVQRFDPETRSDWSKFIASMGPAHLREVISLDALLCPTFFQHLDDNDWKFNVQVDFKTHLFYDLEHVIVRAAGENMNVLALIEEPLAEDVAGFHDTRFDFAGFDLVERDGGISAVTNCGGFQRAFKPTDLSECGLLPNYEKAVAVRALLRKEYPNEPHATDCTLWAIWRLRRELEHLASRG